MEGNPAECTPTLAPIFEDVLDSKTFVDKSALILEVFKTSKRPTVLCTAPRRFGKTVNLNMMQQFFELEVDQNGNEKTAILEEKDNYKLFNSSRIKLKVMENKEFVKTHFGQYPLVKLNFVCAPIIERKSDAMKVCRRALSRAFKQHRYLYKFESSPLEEDEKKKCEQWCDETIPDENVIRGLTDLVVYLNKFHNKLVFLLVDEYDSIASNALYNIKNADPEAELYELERAASFPIEIIGDALKTEPEMCRGVYITGILNLSGVRISSLLGNVSRQQFGTKNLLDDFYGFTEDDVDALFNSFGVKEELKKKAKAKYNGYFNGAKERLYNPQSVVQFLSHLKLKDGALQNFWQQSGYIENVNQLFQKDDVRMLLNKLLGGAIDFKLELKPLEISDLKSLHNILSNRNKICDKEIVVRFLTSLGYLTYSFDDHTLKIPNDELIDEMSMRLRVYYIETYGINVELAHDCSVSFFKLVGLCDEDDSSRKFQKQLTYFENAITRLLQESDIIRPLNEATLQCIISWVCTIEKFQFGNELIIPIYSRRVDLVIYNDKSGIIMELKCDPHAVEDAIKQIFKNHYCNVFKIPKCFNDHQKTPSLSLVMGMHVNSEHKASVMCLRRKDIIGVLDRLKIAAEPSLEGRIDIAVNCLDEELFNSFCRKAIRGS